VEYKNRLVLFLLIMVFAGIIPGVFFGCQNNDNKEQQSSPPASININSIIEEKRIRQYITKLTSEDFQGRRAGTSGEAEAALYLAQELKKQGLEPLGDKGTFFQSFPIPEAGLRWQENRLVFFLQEDNRRLLSDNIIGVLKSAQRPEEYILLSAHYDHLGVWQNQLYPGANDNASGVSAVLEMTRILSSQQKELPYSIIVAFWSAEEMGLLGSNYFVENPPVDLKKVKLAINLDSIGSGTENDFLFWSAGPAMVTDGLYSSWQKWQEINFTKQETTHNTSDHEALAKAYIPAVTVLSDDWLVNNHSALDKVENINYKKITFFSQKVIDFIFSPEVIELLKIDKN
jgi:hypothetical protein